MQDPNKLMFDTENVTDINKMKESLVQEIVSAEDWSKMGQFQADKDDALDNMLKRNPVKDDIKEFKETKKNKDKAMLFDHLFANEQQLYFDEHKHVMPSREKRRLKSILIKKISKGDIYINKVGKIIIRKGKNK